MKTCHLRGRTSRACSMLWWVPLYLRVCLTTESRSTTSLGRSLQEVLFLLKRNGEYSHNSICQKSLFIYKSWLRGLEERLFSGAVSSFLPFSLLLSHSPWEVLLWHVWLLKGLMRPWMLQWMSSPERNISLSLFESENLNTRGSIQGMMECLTEAAICSWLANRELFGQWVQPCTQQTSAFRGLCRRKQETTWAPFQTPAPTWDNLSKQSAFVPEGTIQWVPTAFLETMYIYSQRHSSQRLIYKDLKGQGRDGRHPISICILTDEEWLGSSVPVGWDGS